MASFQNKSKQLCTERESCSEERGGWYAGSKVMKDVNVN